MSEIQVLQVLLLGFLLGSVFGTWLEHKEARKPGHYDD